jgi:nitrogen-specific signal transduction histidine kinase/DNA-binding response OmpR family regulator
MKKRHLKEKIKRLEKQILLLEERNSKLQRDKLTLYHLLHSVNKELDEVLVDKQTFIAMMSHELRSPLNPLLGNCALLLKTDLTEQQKKYLGQLNESAEFLKALISDLLDVSKIKKRKVKLNIQEVNLDKLLLYCAELVESKIDKRVKFQVNIPELPYYVLADKKHLQQIFGNILTNAAKFTEEGKIVFSLTEINEKGNKLEVIVDIEDTGRGIPENIKESVFDPFSSTDIEQGTGLGLYISHELATLMGGNIIVESEEGLGSKFRVIFYCEKSVEKSKDLIVDKLTIDDKRDYSHLKVLIVEDIDLNREFQRELFKVFFSVTVDTAENGRVAIEKIKSNHYDIVFMDIRMPVLDGIEATKEIRKFNKNVYIVCMSANVYREDMDAAELAGMNDFIEKPFEYRDIAARLAHVTSVISKESFESQKNLLHQLAMNHFKDHFDEETCFRLINIAAKDLKKSILTIEENLYTQNLKVLKETFHAMKGIFSNLGLVALAQQADELQQFAKDGDIYNIEERVDGFLLDAKEFFE